MKYFTPQLYVDFNSGDAAVADRADARWEQAMAKYRNRVRTIGPQLPDSVRELAEKACLHDARYLGYTKTPVPNSGGETAMVALQQDRNIVLLFYVLAAEPALSHAHPADVFAQHDVHWLYDEVDVGPDGVYEHEILLSNGRVLSLRFVAFDTLVVKKDDFNRTFDGALTAAVES